nr:MAG TPA: hypothetical protein [Caudoviricetes sp.]
MREDRKLARIASNTTKTPQLRSFVLLNINVIQPIQQISVTET